MIARFFAARRPLGRYVQPNWLMRLPAVGYGLLALLALGYGLAFAFYGTDDPIPFLVPFVVMAALIYWLLPELKNPPEKWIDKLLVGFIVALVCWPDYLALALPGLPWISAIRLFGVPLVIVLLLCLRGSPAFRANILERLNGDVVISRAMLVFCLIAGLSIGLSGNVGASLNRFFVAIMAWFAVFLASVHYFSEPGRVRRLAAILLGATLLSTAIALYEWKYHALPWRDRIPWFLSVDSPQVEMVLAGINRAATGIYRVQSKFSGSIGLGEFFGMALPFVLHLAMTTSRRWLSAGVVVLLLPAMMVVVKATDSRLAFISFVSSLVLYVLYAAVDRWRRRRDSLFGPAVVLAYPAFLLGFVTLSLFWRRLYVMIWGGGAQSFSTESREMQMQMGLPKVMQNPLGHGIGQAAQTLNYYAPGYDFLTIDSYFLSVALEYGVIGFVVFYGMFVWAAGRAAWVALRSNDRDVMFLAPAAIALVNFLISKSIYSQQENHPLAFCLLGLVVALLYRDKVQRGSGQAAGTDLVPARAPHRAATRYGRAS